MQPALEPSLVVLSAVAPERLRPLQQELRAIARRHRLALAGPGADGIDVRRLDALVLTGDPVGEAERVTADAAA